MMWVGGYTPTMGGSARGIGLLRWDADAATLELVDTVPASSPSYLAAGGEGLLYAADEAGRVEVFGAGKFTGGPGGSLRPLGGQPTSGAFPCHLSVTRDRVYVSNYGDGSIDVFPRAADGTLGALLGTLASSGSGPHPAQQGPHAHATLVIGSAVFSADLGSDRVHVHVRRGESLVRTGSTELPAGTGPRDLLAHGGHIIVLGELNGAIWELDREGAIVATGNATETWVDGDHAAGLAVDASGTFLFTGLRGSNRVAVIRRSDLGPVATVSSGGDGPRHLCVIGDTLFVANQLSHSVARFRLDPATGIPTQSGSPVGVASPTFLLPVL